SVLLGNRFRLSTLGGTLTLDGGAGSNRLNVNETDGNVSDSIQVTGSSISSLFVPFTINYQATGGHFQGGGNIIPPAASNSIISPADTPAASLSFSAGAAGTATVSTSGSANIGGVTFGAGSGYQVTISQTGSSLLNASGAVNLGGAALNVSLQSGFTPSP